MEACQAIWCVQSANNDEGADARPGRGTGFGAVALEGAAEMAAALRAVASAAEGPRARVTALARA